MDSFAIIATIIIAAGFVILAGLALWLALDRQRRSQRTAAMQALQQSSTRPAQPPPAPAASPAETPELKEARPAPTGQSAPDAQQSPAKSHDPQHSGLYPAAELYDQTLLPPSKPRQRKTE